MKSPCPARPSRAGARSRLCLALQRGWYRTESEFYLLHFTLTVRCLAWTGASLERAWQRLPAARSFCWLLAYVFYYPVLHNGPALSFPRFVCQVGAQPRPRPRREVPLILP
ncbi:Protein-cysteine N-palmitoyltransferase HHAT [Galemys pyrenaicus]|uniref:Protein-cysteine N-palmitoyltransferase HHAT n=1 Tax=Galemys pyrenaicus TaxID=202257 RepID=A0A8J6DD02_GALPY|nr:Protein-cysteine N-palmitoyltransferase HHAT [Galemys pyrenaicus]